jgi:hypothetical protein
LRDGPTEKSRARGESRQCQDTLPLRGSLHTEA